MAGIPHSQLAPLPIDLPFRLVSKTIGSGAYACIKKGAPKTEATPIFAVKFINKDYALRYGRIKQKQLQMEVTLHKWIGEHSNIIQFYDSGEDSSWMWIAMELAEGGDLFDKVEADAGLTEDIAHAYFTQLVNAVGYMHSKGVGHRDIKPENILLDLDGNLKLADFGMATLFEYKGVRKAAKTLCGSPPYVAPEVLTLGSHEKSKGVGYDADRADIWSCGIVLFVLLAGNTPWSKPEEGRDPEYSEYIKTNGRPDDELWQALPAEVLSLLRAMLKPDPTTRFSLGDVRRHPWFTRKSKHIDSKGRIVDPIRTATTMFESLRVSFDAVPNSQDLMDLDERARPSTLPSTQPDAPVEDMLFDLERPSKLAISSTQPLYHSHVGLGNLPSTQEAASLMLDLPSMSQFSARPEVPLSKTQMARRFGDILPAQRLTKFYSLWKLSLLVPNILEALMKEGVPTRAAPLPKSNDTQFTVKVQTLDSRGCSLSGRIAIDVFASDGRDSVFEVSFVKASGDPLEWRRFFKKVSIHCRNAFPASAAFDAIHSALTSDPAEQKDAVRQGQGIYAFKLKNTGGQEQAWHLDLKETGTVGLGEAPSGKKADVVLSLSDENFAKLVAGKANAQQLFMSGKLKVKGNVMKATKMQPILAKAQSKAKL
ncbi:hypothetical protein DV735_g3696, partial [Chaetothyriales sp. CBS 134920]